MFEEQKLRQQGVKIEEPLKVCANCVRWRRHYVAADPGSVSHYMPPYIPIKCGHCTYPGIKTREESDTCEHFLTLKSMTEEELMEEMTRTWQPG